MRAHLDKERAAYRAGDQRQIITLSGEFHFLIADMAGNSFLSRTLRELETLSALIIILFGTPTHEACPSDHPALVDAIEAGDEALRPNSCCTTSRMWKVRSAWNLPTRQPGPLEAVFA